MRDIGILLAFCSTLFSSVAPADDFVTTVTARQVQPWNGLVEITVGLSCESNDLAVAFCTFAATNSATRAALPVTKVRQVGGDTGSGTSWTRHFIWDVASDLGEMKIDDVAFTVDVKPMGVQLWENGPYWAECNVGASKPEECGYYFWWGDTVGYKRNAGNNGWVSVRDETDFSFSSGNCPTYGENNSQLQSEGYIDATGNLVAAHDAATSHLGAPWRMPTDAEFSALINNCDTEWTFRNGVSGRLVKGRGAYATKSIFLPAAGYGYDSRLSYLGSFGNYWSSTPNSGISDVAWYLDFYSGDFYRLNDYRYSGHSVRPVREFGSASDSVGAVTTHLSIDCTHVTKVELIGVTALQQDASNGLVDIVVTMRGAPNDVAETECLFVATNQATKEGILVAHVTRNGDDEGAGTVWKRKYIWNAASDVHVRAEKIDAVALTVFTTNLSGVQLWENGPYWAECNIGATKPEGYGHYFWWGDTVGYKRNVNNNGWISVGDSTEFSFDSGNCPTYGKSGTELRSAGYIDSTGNLIMAHDAATAHLGAPWRMPTEEEIWALLNSCDTEWTSRNGVPGRLVTGRGDFSTKSIFLPSGGCGNGSGIDNLVASGYYWSSTLDPDKSIDSWSLYFDYRNFYMNFSSRSNRSSGRTVRPLRGFADMSVTGVGVTTCFSLDCSWAVDMDLGGVQLWENGPYWAECNIGASQPEECGYYFWWGDTAGWRRADGGWLPPNGAYAKTISFSSENCPTHGKDNSQLRSEGYIDATGNLAAAHDAATAHLGEPWRMPSDAEFSALINNCTTTWTTRNGMAGLLVTGKGAYESKSIFLPAAGYGYYSSRSGLRSEGSYWSSTPSSDIFSDFAWYLFFFGSGNFGRENYHRYYGQSVRPVRGFAEGTGGEDGPLEVTGVTAQQRYPWNGLVDVVVATQGSEDDLNDAECSFVAMNSTSKVAIPIVHIVRNGDDICSNNVWKRKYIWNAAADVGAVKIDDIALTVETRILGEVQLWEKGPYWAKCNVGASKPEEYGYYFWWGDTVGYKRNSSSNGWVSVKDGSSFSFDSESCPTYGMSRTQLLSGGYIDTTYNLIAEYDAATVYLGESWRIPTEAEFSALIRNCTITWTTRNGVYGRLVTGKGNHSSKSIFLPAAGFGYGTNLINLGSYGRYWSSPTYSGTSDYAWSLLFDSDDFTRDYFFRYGGMSVRPVRGTASDDILTVGRWTTHLSVDCRADAKFADSGHPLVYDAAWYAGGVTAKVTANGQEIVSGTEGTYEWKPSSEGDYLLTLNVYDTLGEVVGTESVWVAGESGSGEDNNYTDAVVGKEVTGLDEPVTVPATWVTDFLVQHYGMGKVDAFRQLFGGDLAGALAKPTGKQGIGGEVHTVWDDYVAGTDPTDPASVFTTTIAIVDGKVVLDWSPNLNLGSESRLYRVKSKLKLSDAWTCPPVTGHHFFMAEVALPDGKTQTASPGVIGNASPEVNGGADKLAHRWSFNGNLNDSVGNRTATAIGSVSSDGLTYTLSGDSSTVAYIDLGTGLFADGVTEFTIETWVTPYATGWRRIWDMADQFGQCWNGKENLMGVRDHISWTSYATNVKTFIAVVCAALPSGGWSLVYYHLDAETGATLSSYASTTVGSDWSPQKVCVNALLLGKSNAPQDPYGNASYDEFRIWNRALSEDELKKSVKVGPDQLP